MDDIVGIFGAGHLVAISLRRRSTTPRIIASGDGSGPGPELEEKSRTGRWPPVHARPVLDLREEFGATKSSPR